MLRSRLLLSHCAARRAGHEMKARKPVTSIAIAKSGKQSKSAASKRAPKSKSERVPASKQKLSGSELVRFILSPPPPTTGEEYIAQIARAVQNGDEFEVLMRAHGEDWYPAHTFAPTTTDGDMFIHVDEDGRFRGISYMSDLDEEDHELPNTSEGRFVFLEASLFFGCR